MLCAASSDARYPTCYYALQCSAGVNRRDVDSKARRESE